MSREDWTVHAACRGADVDMFPTTQHALSQAVGLCASCPVVAMCAAAGADESDGVWGGVPRGPGFQRCTCGTWVIRRRHASATVRCPACQADTRRQTWAASKARQRKGAA